AFYFTPPATLSTPPLSLHDALPIFADLCAAPGGKTAQLAAAGARVTAVDRSAARLDRLRQNLTRLGLAAETIATDATEWQAGPRSEEHTSELQSRENLVCRLLLEKK